ncbi:hypothetical protein GRI97_14590 [Altererythrobacter xixiisoli]|uniref:SHOCT domain-containing protein n=1 Tax=Croceibacterium xixiisoli TaxID=1476466 RepID=A0A6I4U015_9SPHN|nr:SHOCT domain-containing protein [Croceibacterium xixiisoli]MXP00219.1 hypothetical protein [Croceibacterium xixiisoli]
MADLDALERLNRLRESGGLTQEEFEQEKARLLAAQAVEPAAPPNKTRLWMLGIGAAVIALASIGYVLTRQDSADGGADEATVADKAALDSPALASAAPTPTPSSPEELYAWATDVARLGSKPAIFEEQLGKADEKQSNFMAFQVGACDVEYQLSNGVVESIGLQISPRCKPVVDDMVIGPDTTFASVKEGYPVADCIGGVCGNAADPTIDLFYTASRAPNSVGYYFVGDYDDATSRAMDLWVTAIAETNGAPTPGDLDPSLLTCLKDAPPEVSQVLASKRVSKVYFGFNLRKHCPR